MFFPHAINGAHKQAETRQPSGVYVTWGHMCWGLYVYIGDRVSLSGCFFYLCMLISWRVKRTQIQRQWEGARISDKALRRSGWCRDQRRSNRCRVPEWGRVPLPSAACLTQHTDWMRHSACTHRHTHTHTLPQPGWERLILTVSVHVSFINCLESLLVYLCDYRNHT